MKAIRLSMERMATVSGGSLYAESEARMEERKIISCRHVASN